MCPRCRQNAPLVYRGVNAFCTACGAPRVPLATHSVTLAGQPSKVGGTVARVIGWGVLIAGWTFAALLAGLIVLLNGGWAAAVVGGIIGLVALVVAYALLRSGKELKKSGDSTELATKTQAIFALANARGGILRAWDVAQMLHLTPKEGDDILTKLAKEHPDFVTLDVDDHGNVLYRFPGIHWGGVSRMAPNAVPPHVRIAEPPMRVDASSDEPVRVDAHETRGEPIDEEFAGPEPSRQKVR